MELAIITGASRGIGKSIAIKFAQNGINVIINCRSRLDEANEVAKICESFGVRAKAMAWDVSNFHQCQDAITEIEKEFARPTILINNAGITKDTLLMRMSEEQFDDVISSNLKSVFNMCKLCSSLMIKEKKGCIVNISSVVGLYGNAGQMNYAASKAGIIGITKSLAKELGSRAINVNAVAPGFIQTDMTDELSDDIKNLIISNSALKRLGNAEEVADLVLFLSSDKSKYITGQTIEISGGLSL